MPPNLNCLIINERKSLFLPGISCRDDDRMCIYNPIQNGLHLTSMDVPLEANKQYICKNIWSENRIVRDRLLSKTQHPVPGMVMNGRCGTLLLLLVVLVLTVRRILAVRLFVHAPGRRRGSKRKGVRSSSRLDGHLPLATVETNE